MNAENAHQEAYTMEFDPASIKHMGFQMYSTMPAVITELVANCWDANATKVEIQIPETPISPHGSEIVISDDGIGMSDRDIRERYLIVGRDRREQDGVDQTPKPFCRKVMGRKGIGKFSAFGIATEIEIESFKDGNTSRFKMNYEQMISDGSLKRSISFPSLTPSGDVYKGTKITLRQITKFHNTRIPLEHLRKRLARRFAIIGGSNEFEVIINGTPISVEDRDLKRLLERDKENQPYIWTYDHEEIKPHTGWTVSGWIGALRRTSPVSDDIERGIALLARGKMVQEPFIFEAVLGQQFALSYIIGELHVEFVDENEDTIGTSRNTLVWDTEHNISLKEWGKAQMNRIAREWATKRKEDNIHKLEANPIYQDFQQRSQDNQDVRGFSLADKLIRQAIDQNPDATAEDIEPIIQNSLDFLEFSAFEEIADDLAKAQINNIPKLLQLFSEWQIVEAKELARVTHGRIQTIEKLQKLVDTNALEVPTLHQFLKEFPWVIDPKWTLVADEVQYSQLLKETYPESQETLESDRRIDFLCIREGRTMVIVEIKRPTSRASDRDLNQIEDYVIFLRGRLRDATDPEHRHQSVVGYLLCGDVVGTDHAQGRVENLERSGIYVRKYRDMLQQVETMHKDIMQKYNDLKQAKNQGKSY